MLLTGFIIISIIAVAYFYLKGRNDHLPPGPRGLPLVGCIPYMDMRRKERAYIKWWKKYGDIYSVKGLLNLNSVILCDADLIREAFTHPGTTGRLTLPVLSDLLYMDVGLIFSTGSLWQKSRRFTLHNLRNFGMGRSRMEQVIQAKVTEFMDEILAPSLGQPVKVEDGLKVTIANIIWGVISSEQFSIDDRRALDIIKTTEDMSDDTFGILLLIMFPFLKFLPESWTAVGSIKKKMSFPIDTLFLPAVEKHKKDLNLDAEPRDYIDAFLLEQVRQPEVFTTKHLARSLFDLFFAGFDTTGNTILWALIYLSKHTDIQQRLREELQRETGERQPCLADRPNLPYTEAVIMEVQRLANVAPYGLEHITTEQIELRGYTIPAGTMLVSLLAAVHTDPRNFDNPDDFNPSRFIDAEGKLRPHKALIPFSAGKRSCLGEAMARAELFLFIANIVKKYSFRFPDGFEHDMTIIEKKMTIRQPTPYELIFKEV